MVQSPASGALRYTSELARLRHVLLTEADWLVVTREVSPNFDVMYNKERRIRSLSIAISKELLGGVNDLTHDEWMALGNEQKYSLIIHAAVRRCSLPWPIATHTRYNPTAILVKNLAVFKEEWPWWAEAISKYFAQPLLRSKVKSAADYRAAIEQDVQWAAVGIWLAGESYTSLTSGQLRACAQRWQGRAKHHVSWGRVVRVLFAASHPAATPELVKWFGYGSTGVDERAKKHWDLVQLPLSDTTGAMDTAAGDLKDKALSFVAVLKAACSEAQTTRNRNGAYTLRKTSVRWATGLEREIRHFITWSISNGVVSWQDAVAQSAFTSYYRARQRGDWSPAGAHEPGPIGAAQLKNVRAALRFWLQWQSYSTDPDVDADILMPFRTTKGVKKYSLPPNTSLITRFLIELIANQSELIDDTKYLDYYSRRCALLLCLTGLRPNEVLLLNWDCIRSQDTERHPFTGTDENGQPVEFWILQINRTKTNPIGREIRVGHEVAKRIFELQDITPRHRTIFVSADKEADTGDDLEAYRLFPSSPAQTEVIRVGYLKRWMERLQVNSLALDYAGVLATAEAKRFLTPYDLRRVRVSTLKMLEVSRKDIAKHLGHRDLQTQDEYHTNQDWMANQLRSLAKRNRIADMILRGKDPLDAPEDVAAREVGRQLINTPVVEELAEFLASQLANNPALRDLGSSEQAKKADSASRLTLPFSLAPLYGGIPLTTKNCAAHVFVDCHSNDLTCGGCQWYKPDPDLIFEHEAYLFRCYIYAHFCKAEANELPLGLRKPVSIKLQGTDDRPGWLDRSEALLQNTFGSTEYGFGFAAEQLDGLRKHLQAKALSYWRKNSKTRPDPNQLEAMAYLGTSFFREE